MTMILDPTVGVIQPTGVPLPVAQGGTGSATIAAAAASLAPIQLSTPQITTSGTAINFTGIPAGVKRITILASGISHNGTDGFVARIGTNAGFVSSGYVGTLDVSNVPQLFTVGVGLFEATGTAAANNYNSICVWSLVDPATNKWMAQSTTYSSNATQGFRVGMSAITLAGAADRVQITTVGGTAVFDLGTVNVSWEF